MTSPVGSGDGNRSVHSQTLSHGNDHLRFKEGRKITLLSRQRRISESMDEAIDIYSHKNSDNILMRVLDKICAFVAMIIYACGLADTGIKLDSVTRDIKELSVPKGDMSQMFTNAEEKIVARIKGELVGFLKKYPEATARDLHNLIEAKLVDPAVVKKLGHEKTGMIIDYLKHAANTIGAERVDAIAGLWVK